MGLSLQNFSLYLQIFIGLGKANGRINTQVYLKGDGKLSLYKSSRAHFRATEYIYILWEQSLLAALARAKMRQRTQNYHSVH